MNVHDLDALRRRPLQYWHVDGTQELLAGAMFVLIGGVYLGASLLDAPVVAGLLLPVLLIAGGRAGRRAVLRLKERVTFPRTGRIVVRRPSARRRGLLAGAAAAGVGILMAVRSLLPGSAGWELLTGVVIAGGVLAVGLWLALPRLVVLGVMGTAFAFALGLAGLGAWLGTGVFLLGMGAGLLASGGMTLRGYLRSTVAWPGE